MTNLNLETTNLNNSSQNSDLLAQVNQLKKQFENDGYLIIKKAFLPESLESIKQDVKNSSKFAWREKFAGGKLSVSETSNIFAQTPTVRQVLENSFPLIVIEAIIGQSLLLFRDAFIIKEPNLESRFPLHQDSEFWDIQPESLVSMWIPFQKTNETNGVLRVVPTSHKVRYEHRVMITDWLALPKFVNTLLRKSAKNSSSKDRISLLGRLLGAFSSVINTQVIPFLSKHFKPFEKFAELFVVRQAKTLWNQALVPDLELGDCIIYHSKTVHGSAGNSALLPRIAYVPTFMGANFTRNQIPVSEPSLGYVPVSSKYKNLKT